MEERYKQFEQQELSKQIKHLIDEHGYDEVYKMVQSILITTKRESMYRDNEERRKKTADNRERLIDKYSKLK